jgi:integrase
MNEHIINTLKTKRPNISKSSLKTYESVIRNLYNTVFNDDKYDLDKFNTESNKVLEVLKSDPPNIRKTKLAAIVVITDNDGYRELMLEDIKAYNKEHQKQEKKTENWVEKDEIEKMYNALEHNANMIYKKNNLSNTDLQEIQNYVILALLGGLHIPPRRSKDYVDMKIKNIDIENDNYISKNDFVFNSYKTSKTYGQQKVKIPLKLKKILLKWKAINPTEYLLFDSSLNKLSNVKLNQRLNKITGKKAGVNQMRKTFLSSKYADTIDTKKELENDFKMMGSSILQETIYIKK